jgi:hypothetical protein
MPFIARYRKEAPGRLDEVSIAAIRDRLGQLRALGKQRRADQRRPGSPVTDADTLAGCHRHQRTRAAAGSDHQSVDKNMNAY